MTTITQYIYIFCLCCSSNFFYFFRLRDDDKFFSSQRKSNIIDTGFSMYDLNALLNRAMVAPSTTR